MSEYDNVRQAKRFGGAKALPKKIELSVVGRAFPRDVWHVVSTLEASKTDNEINHNE